MWQVTRNTWHMIYSVLFWYQRYYPHKSIDSVSPRPIHLGKVMKGQWSHTFKFWLRNDIKLFRKKNIKRMVLTNLPAVHSWRVSRGGSMAVAVGVNDMWQVTCNKWHATCDTWHVTPDTSVTLATIHTRREIHFPHYSGFFWHKTEKKEKIYLKLFF